MTALQRLDQNTVRTYVAAIFGWSGGILMAVGLVLMFISEEPGHKVFSTGITLALLAVKIDDKRRG